MLHVFPSWSLSRFKLELYVLFYQTTDDLQVSKSHFIPIDYWKKRSLHYRLHYQMKSTSDIVQPSSLRNRKLIHICCTTIGSIFYSHFIHTVLREPFFRVCCFIECDTLYRYCSPHDIIPSFVIKWNLVYNITEISCYKWNGSYYR